jgi:hypothetical protein
MPNTTTAWNDKDTTVQMQMPRHQHIRDRSGSKYCSMVNNVPANISVLVFEWLITVDVPT